MIRKKQKINRESRVFGSGLIQTGDGIREPENRLVADYEPRFVSFLEPGRCKVEVIYLGKEMTLVVIEGLVFGWGAGFFRLVSLVGTDLSLTTSTIHLLYANKSDPCIALSSSDTHIVLITESGKALSCGSSKLGALGTGNSYQDLSEPMPVDSGHPARNVVCCKESTYFLVTPPLSKLPLEQIMQFEGEKVPFIISFLVEKLRIEGNRSPSMFERDLTDFSKAHCVTEGIFRTSGSSGVIDKMLEAFSADKLDDIIHGQPTDSYAGLLKTFLRQLPTPLIPITDQIAFCEIIGKRFSS